MCQSEILRCLRSCGEWTGIGPALHARPCRCEASPASLWGNTSRSGSRSSRGSSAETAASRSGEPFTQRPRQALLVLTSDTPPGALLFDVGPRTRLKLAHARGITAPTLDALLASGYMPICRDSAQGAGSGSSSPVSPILAESPEIVGFSAFWGSSPDLTGASALRRFIRKPA